ncbi:MAG: LapA family protein [Gammaproteobacteria bacterium]|jgi:putative membrane protein
MKIFGYLIFLLIILIGISFAIMNSSLVAVNYYIGVKQLPLSFLLMLAFGIGLIIGFLALFISLIRLHTNLGRTKRKLRIAEQEINNLRTMPIKDEH